MSNSDLCIFKPDSFRRVDLTIEQLLERLAKYAFVSTYNCDSDDTWSANATMRIKTKGATFKVSSGFKHPSMKAALSTLLELVENAVEELGDKHVK